MASEFQRLASAAVPHIERFAAICERNTANGTPDRLEHELRGLIGELSTKVSRDEALRMLFALAAELREPRTKEALLDHFALVVSEAETRVAKLGGAPSVLLDLLHEVDHDAPGVGCALLAAEIDPRMFGLRALRPLAPLAIAGSTEEPEHAVRALLDVVKTAVEVSYSPLATVMLRVDRARRGFQWEVPRTKDGLVSHGAVINEAADRFSAVNRRAVLFRNAFAHEASRLSLDDGLVRVPKRTKQGVVIEEFEIDDLFDQAVRIFRDGIGLVDAYNAYNLGLLHRTGALSRALDVLAELRPDVTSADTGPREFLDLRAARERLAKLRPRSRKPRASS